VLEPAVLEVELDVREPDSELEALAELLDQCERARVDVARPHTVRVAAPDLPPSARPAAEPSAPADSARSPEPTFLGLTASRRQKGSVIAYKGKRGIVWRIKFVDATGRAKMETVGAERHGVAQTDAEALLRKRLVAVEENNWEKPKPITFQQFAKEGWTDREGKTRGGWFAEQERQRGWQATTTEVYENVLKRLIASFGKMQLGAIRPRDVAAYVAEQKLAAATVNRDVGILYDVMKTAKTEELIGSNPVEGANRPRVPDTDWRILKPDEVRRVAKAFTDPQARTIFLMLAVTGLRKSEAQALRWRDVSLGEKRFRVVKLKSKAGRRTIAIPQILLDELERHYQRTPFKGDDDRVFCHARRGSVYSAEMWRPLFAAALKAAGIHDHVRPFHDLRHTAITNRAAAGLSPIVLMYEAGHSSMAITQRYIDFAGVAFADEAAQAERRMLGAVSTEPSTDLRTSHDTEQHAAGLRTAQ
jgi:integrase